MEKMSKRSVKKSEKLADAVARMIHRVDLSEGHEGSGEAATSSTNKGGDDDDDDVHLNQGPLTPQELAELSFLCTATTAAADSKRGSKSSTQAVGFAAVEGDQLVALMELLDRHVNLAVSVNLMESAAGIAALQESPSQAAMAVDQVRQKKIRKQR